jgi:hypothetical protein
VTGSIQDANGTTKYTGAQLASADPTEHQFVSAIWDIFTLEETAAVVSFGTDNGLHTNAGWDNVTGVGSPNAKAFADFFFGKEQPRAWNLPCHLLLGGRFFLCHEFARGVRHESSRV